MSDPIRPKLPGMQPPIDSTIPEKRTTNTSTPSQKSSEPAVTANPEKMKKASQNLATSKLRDAELQTISQKMNILKNLSPEQQKLLEAAKKDKPALNTTSPTLEKPGIDAEKEEPGLDDSLKPPKDRLNPFEFSGVEDYFSEEQGPPWTETPTWGEAPSWTEIDN